MRFRKILFLLILGTAAYFGAHYLIGNEGGSYKTVGSISSNFGSQMKSSYKQFEGEKYRTIALVEGRVFHLEASIETNDGHLELSFIDPEGHLIYPVSNPDAPISKEFEIKATGEYQLKVAGQHEGSYELDWNIQ